MRRLVLAVCLVAFPVAAEAADPAGKMAPSPYIAPGYDVLVTLGAGAQMKPEYEGADSYDVSPMPIFGLTFKLNPFTGQPTTETGFGIRPAFRYLSKREGSGELAGLNDVDAAFELGLKLSWTEETWRVFVEGRQGMGGHSGQVFDLGAEVDPAPAAGRHRLVRPARVLRHVGLYRDLFRRLGRRGDVASSGRFADLFGRCRPEAPTASAPASTTS